jgi:hypothetical protein
LLSDFVSPCFNPDEVREQILNAIGDRAGQ